MRSVPTPFSPLLALIALQGIETHLKSLGTQRNPIHTVFYADDFVVFAPQLYDIKQAKVAVEQWLQGIGLELHPSKTKITHTFHGQAGFDFLGFHIRQYPQGSASGCFNCPPESSDYIKSG